MNGRPSTRSSRGHLSSGDLAAPRAQRPRRTQTGGVDRQPPPPQRARALWRPYVLQRSTRRGGAPAHGIPTGRSDTSPRPRTHPRVGGARDLLYARLVIWLLAHANVCPLPTPSVFHGPHPRSGGARFQGRWSPLQRGPPLAKKPYGYPMNWRPAVAEASAASLAAASVGHRAPVHASHLFTL